MPSIEKVSAKGGGDKVMPSVPKVSAKGGEIKEMPSVAKVSAKDGTNGAAVPSVVASSAASETGSGCGGGRQSPSANGMPGNVAVELTPLGQINSILEKKVRNLDKRKAKLDGLKAQRQKLKPEQEQALTKYEEVVTIVETLREIKIQVAKNLRAETKANKKRAWQEQQDQKLLDIEKVGGVLRVQHLFNLIHGPSGKQLIQEFAPQLKKSELDILLKFAKLVPMEPDLGDDAVAVEEQVLVKTNHFISLQAKKEEEVCDLKVTYKELGDTIDILLGAGILAPKPEEPEVQDEVEEESDEVDVVGVEEDLQALTIEAVTEEGPGTDSSTVPAQAPVRQPRQPQQQQQHSTRHTAPVNGHNSEDEPESQHRLGYDQEQGPHHHQAPHQAAQQAPLPSFPNHPAHPKEAIPAVAVHQQHAASQQQPAGPVRAEKQPTPEPSFNFLQDSQIDLDSPLMNDPAVVMVQGGRKPDQGFPPPPVFNGHGGANSMISQHLIQQHSAQLAAYQQQLQQQQQAPPTQQQPSSHIQNAQQQQMHSQQQQQQQQNYIQPSADSQQQQRLPQQQSRDQPQQQRQPQLPRVPQPGTVNYSQQQQQQEHDNSSRYSQQETIRYNSSKDHHAVNSTVAAPVEAPQHPAAASQHPAAPQHPAAAPQPGKDHEGAAQQHSYNNVAAGYPQQHQNGAAAADTEIGTWGEEEGAAGDNSGNNDRRRDDRGGSRGGPRGGGSRGYSRDGRGSGGGRGYSRGRGGGGDGGGRGGYRGGRGGGEGAREFRGEREFRGGDREFSRGGGEQRSGDYNRGGDRGADYRAGGDREFRGGRGGGEREYRGGDGEYRGGDRPRGNRGYGGGRGRGGPRGGGGGPRGAGGPRE